MQTQGNSRLGRNMKPRQSAAVVEDTSQVEEVVENDAASDETQEAGVLEPSESTNLAVESDVDLEAENDQKANVAVIDGFQPFPDALADLRRNRWTRRPIGFQ